MFGRETILNKIPEAGGCTNTVDLYNPFPDGGGVALYQLNGDATDVSGNYDGTATNVTYGTGQFGQAGVFNGSSSYIDLPLTTSSLFAGKNTFTLSLWFNTTTTGRNDFFNDYAGTSFNQICRINNTGTAGDLYFAERYSGGTTTYTTSGTAYNDGVWHNVVMVFNDSSNTKTIYVDGSLETTYTVSSNGWNSSVSQKTVLGAEYGGSYNKFLNGQIDQVRIFNRALRPYEVEALYTEEYCTPTIVPSEHFNTVIYTGDSSSSNSITGVGFQPDLVWIKERTSTSGHQIADSVRTAGYIIGSDSTGAEFYATNRINSFDTDGFTVGSSGGVNANTDDYVAWNFKAGGAAVTNTDGTITSQVSANTEAGFSIVTWSGDSSAATIGHGLGKKPNVIIFRNRTTTSNWLFVDTNINQGGYLDLTNSFTSARYDAWLNNAEPTDSLLPLGAFSYTNGPSMLAYCFAEVEGFSNFGSYVGTGASGNTVVTGFEPAFVMIKRTDSTGNWFMLDNKRDNTNPNNLFLLANASDNEKDLQVTDNLDFVNFLENGFEVLNGGTFCNANGGKYIYMAFAADPTTIEPSLEDSFNTVTYTGNGSAQAIGGVFEGGASFNGSSSKIQLPSSLSVATGSNDFSISTWVFLDTMPSNFYSVATTQDNWYFYIFIASDGSVRTYNQNVSVNSAAGVVTTGQWYHIVATLSSTSGKNVYLNGVNVASSTNTSNCNAFTTGHTALGYYQSNATVQYLLDGSIDQARFFDTALTAAQVTELYEETDADSSVCDFPSGAGAVALYELNGNANDACGTYNGTATNVTWLNNGVGFQPDLVWIKPRSFADNHVLADSVRGVNKSLASNTTSSENSLGITSFDSNGFSLPQWGNVTSNGNDFVAWNWKGAEIPAINSNGSIPSVVSANPAAGFSIVSYTAPASGYFKVGHGLDVKPSMVITKVRNQTGYSWYTWHTGLTNETNSYLALNVTSAENNSYTMWPYGFDTETFSHNVGFSAIASSTHIAYCFAEVAGFSKFGSYSANASGVSVTTDFEPAFVMVKSTTSNHSWYMIDNKRGSTSPNSVSLFPNLINAEASGYGIYFNSTGFTVAAGVGNGTNGGGNSYIYMAFANQF